MSCYKIKKEKKYRYDVPPIRHKTCSNPVPRKTAKHLMTGKRLKTPENVEKRREAPKISYKT